MLDRKIVGILHRQVGNSHHSAGRDREPNADDLSGRVEHVTDVDRVNAGIF
jgi:hypothetical protein